MEQTHLIYAALLLLSGTASLAVILITWNRRYAPGAKALITMMAGTTIWAMTYAVHWIYPDTPAPFFWLDATYLGVVIAPTAFLVFAVQFNQFDRWLNKHTFWILSLIPFLTLVILWTDPYHQLFFAGKRLPTATDIFDGGPWFWVNIIYSYAMIIAGYIIMYLGYFRQVGIYRKQRLLIIIGSIVAPIANLVSLFNLNPLPGLDLTPFSFTILGTFYSFGLLRLSMFDIVPVAKEIVIDTMQQGMLIFDPDERLVELNENALTTLGLPRSSLIGKPAVDVFLGNADMLRAWQNRETLDQPIQVHMPDGRIQMLNMDRLMKNGSRLQGWLIICSDVTSLVETETRLQQANHQLEERLQQIEALQAVLKEQAIRDPLTGLLNRRFLEEALIKEEARAERKQYEMMILMLDIDSFKDLNDTHGHQAGDEVLKQLGDLLLRSLRKDDFVVRMGGEEFLVLMSDIKVQEGLDRAEKIRTLVEQYEFTNGSHIHHITISIGAASYPSSSRELEMVIRLADIALYRAKAAGKNRVSADAKVVA